jgi:protein TonB
MISLCPSALASLDDSLVRFCESLEELKAAKSVDISEVIEQFTMAAESARSLRASVLSELPEASWQNREELEALIAEIQERLEARALEQLRSRLLALATELERGSIVHRRALRLNELNQLREQAINELRSKAGLGGTPQTLPGPEADQWIEWACGLKEPEDAESLQTLRNGFARLDDFVANLEPGMWTVKTVPEASLQNGEELERLIEEVREQLRSRLLALATELERGSIVHHRALRVDQLNQLREQAINELRSQAGVKGAPQTLPGPEADEWIEWACGLKEPEDAESLQTLRNGFAHLDDFVANLEPDMWIAAGSPPLEILPESERSADKTHQEQSRPETNGFEEPVVSSGTVPIELEAPKSSGGRDEPRVPCSLDEPSLSALESDTLTPNSVTPPRTEEAVQWLPAQKRALPASIIGPVTDRVRHFKLPVEPPFTIADVFRGVERLFGGKWRMRVATVLVLVVAGQGAIQWISQRKQKHTSNGPVQAIESKIPDLTRGNPENKGSDQSGKSIDSETHPSSPKLQTEKPSKAKDQSVNPKPLPTTPPTKQASKLDDGGSRPPVITIPNNVAMVKKEEAPAKGATEVPDSVPRGVPVGVPNSVTNIIRDIPVAEPKLAAQAAQKVRVSSGVAQGLLIRQVAPLYPLQARQAHIQGTVVLQAVIGKDGSVQSVHALSGHPMLIKAAGDAVKQWRYKPYYLNGEPVEADTQINVNFKLPVE